MPRYKLQGPDGRTVTIEAADRATALRGAQEWAAANPAPSQPVTPQQQAALDYTRRIAEVSAMAARRPAPPRTRPNETRRERTQREGEAYARTQAGVSGDVQQAIGSGALRALGAIGDMGQIARDPMRLIAPGRESQTAALDRMGAFYNPTTDEGKLAEGAAMMLPNAAFGPGGFLARTAAVAVPAIAGEVGRIGTRELGYDEQSQENMRGVGQFLGGLGSGVRFGRGGRPAPPRPADPNAPFESRGINAATRGMTPAKLREAAERLRAQGIEPTLTDVTDEAGRGVIRAAASRRTPARQRVQDFAAARAENLPDRMGRQARRIISDDPRTPEQIASALRDRRGQLATTEYAEPYATPVTTQRGTGASAYQELPANVRAVLEDGEGASAVGRALKAARANQDEALVAQLEALRRGDARVPITAGALDRVRMAFREMSASASAAQRGSLARGYAGRVKALDSVLDNVDALKPARATYRELSSQIDAADTGSQFLARNTDEFEAATSAMSPEARAVAQAAARRAIERAAGENVSSAPGVARRLALAPEQQARNRALLGGDDAARLQSAMRAELDAVENARYIAPNTGPQSFNRAQDDAAARMADEAIGTAANLATGNKVAIMTRIARWATERGMGDGDAQLLAEAAIDPARLPGIIAAMEARNPQLASQLKQLLIRGAPVAAIAGSTAASQAQARPSPPR